MNESFFTNTFLGCSNHGLLYFLTVADTTQQENKTCKKKMPTSDHQASMGISVGAHCHPCALFFLLFYM